MKHTTLFTLTLLMAAVSAHAQQAFPATLVGHAALPARTFVSAPKDAPVSLRTSGKYTSPDGKREDRLESIAGLLIAGIIVGVVQSLAVAYLDPLVGGAVGSILPFVIMLGILVIRPTGVVGWKPIERR